MPQLDRPQRRTFKAVSASSEDNSRLTIHASRYLAMAAEKASEETDLDPIYTYDLNGNRASMIDPTGLTILGDVAAFETLRLECKLSPPLILCRLL